MVKTGQFPPLDLSAIEAEPTVILTESYNNPEQWRRWDWIDAMKQKDLKNLLHGSKHDADELRGHWSRFAGGPIRGWSRLSNIKRSDHVVNGGDTVEFKRTYSGPSDGRPGRLYCAESLQDAFRPFRSLMLEPVASDCDMSKFATRTARWLAKIEGYQRIQLDGLLADPQEWQRRAHLATGMSEKAIKNRLNLMWQCKPNDPRVAKVKGFQEFNLLHNEVQELKSSLYHNPKYRWAHRHCSADNIYGTFFGIVLFAIEAKITNACVQFARREYGWNILAIVHDGFNPEGKHDADEEALRQFEAIAEDLCPGIEMKWAWKPFDFWVYDKKTGERLREVRVPPDYVPEEGGDGAEDDGDEDETFEGDGTFKPDYHTVKRQFEETRFLVNGRVVDWFTYQKHEQPRMEIISKLSCRDNWGHYAYSTRSVKRDANRNAVKDANGRLVYARKNHNFLARWFVDPDIKNYRSFSINPDPDAIPEESYNMWKEYHVKGIKEWDRKEGRRIVIKYLDFVHKLFGQDTRQTMFGLKWQAHPFQHPGEKPQVMACLLGPQGGGKTTFLAVSMAMMGPEQCYVTKNPDQNVYGRNGTTCIANKKLVNIQEVDADKVRPFIAGLRPLVTDSPLEVKGMGQNPINVDSVHVVALSSNFLNAMNVDSEMERRFWIVYCTLYWSSCFKSAEETKAFFDVFQEELKSNDFLAELHLFYTRLPDVPKRFNGKVDVPIGELQKVSRESNQEWVKEFLRSFVDEGRLSRVGNFISMSGNIVDKDGEPIDERIVMRDGWVTVRNDVLEGDLRQFTQKKGWEKSPNMGHFGTKLSYLKVEHPNALENGNEWDDETQNSVRCWRFNLDVLRPVVKSKYRAIRQMISNRKDHKGIKDKYVDLKKAKNVFCPLYHKVNLFVLKSELKALETEYEEMTKPEVKEETNDEFDPEELYDRVMGTGEDVPMIPDVTERHDQIEYIPPPQEPEQGARAYSAPVAAPELAGLFHCEDEAEDPKVVEARRLQQEMRAKRAAEGAPATSNKRSRPVSTVDVFAEWQQGRK